MISILSLTVFLFQSGNTVACEGTSCETARQDEIVVTPTRGNQTSKNYAGNISLLDTEELQLIAAEHPSEIAARVPGVFIHRGSGQEHLTAIRSPVLTGGAGAGSFLYLMNGVPLRSAGFANVNGLFEAPLPLASTIEIIRGPSGAQYGANAIHGVINVNLPTALPSQSTGSYKLSASENIRQLTATGTLSDTTLWGLSVVDDTGFRADSGSDKQQFTLSYTPNDHDWLGPTLLSTTNLNQETAGFVLGDDAYDDPALRETNPNPEAFRDARHIQLQSALSINVGSASLNISPYARWNEQDFLLHFLPSRALEQSGHWSAGLQSDLSFTPDADPTAANFRVGLDLDYTQGFLREEQERETIFSYTQGLHYDYEVTATTLAPFFQGTTPLLEGLFLDYGARLDHTRYAYENLTQSNIVGRFLRAADRDDDFTTFSPDLALRREWADSIGWISYKEGARPPQTTDLYRLQLNQDIEDVAPEETAALEIGYRRLWDQGRIELTAYHQTKENFYFRDADGFNVVDGETRHVGIEMDLDLNITESLQFSTSATYAAHTYQFDRAIQSGANPQEAISTGNDIDTAPRTLANTRLRWNLTDKFQTELSWQHVGDYYIDASNINDYPGHDILDLRASYAVGDFTFFGSIRNLADTRYAERADFAFGNERYFPNQGRTLTLGFRLDR